MSFHFTHEDVSSEIRDNIQNLQHVSINLEKVDQLMEVLRENIESEWWKEYQGAPYFYQSAEDPLHGEDAIMFNFVNTAQMWLIWERDDEGRAEPLRLVTEGRRNIGSHSITNSHRRAINEGRNLLSADYLERMTIDDVREIYRDESRGTTPIQGLERRLDKFRELGRGLNEHYAGSVVKLYEEADGYLYKNDGTGLLQILERHFPISYSDFPHLKLPQVAFYGLLGVISRPELLNDRLVELLNFKDIDKLEGGADYYRPYFLMRIGLITPLGRLEQLLIDEQEIDDPEMEKDFRSATIWVMREIAQRFPSHGEVIPLLETTTHATALMKCRLCKVGAGDDLLRCDFKPVCDAYNGGLNGRRMSLKWPLVDTTKY